jgi:hypothetical protein
MLQKTRFLLTVIDILTHRSLGGTPKPMSLKKLKAYLPEIQAEKLLETGLEYFAQDPDYRFKQFTLAGDRIALLTKHYTPLLLDQPDAVAIVDLEIPAGPKKFLPVTFAGTKLGKIRCQDAVRDQWLPLGFDLKYVGPVSDRQTAAQAVLDYARLPEQGKQPESKAIPKDKRGPYQQLVKQFVPGTTVINLTTAGGANGSVLSPEGEVQIVGVSRDGGMFDCWTPERGVFTVGLSCVADFTVVE